MYFAQHLLKGKRIYNKHTGHVYFQFEAYYVTRHNIKEVMDGVHPIFGIKDATGWVNGHMMFR